MMVRNTGEWEGISVGDGHSDTPRGDYLRRKTFFRAPAPYGPREDGWLACGAPYAAVDESDAYMA